MRRTHRVLAFGLACTAVIAGRAVLVAQESPSAAAFQVLTSLVGHWRGEFRGTEITLRYTLTADSSTLMEESQPKSEPAMITMFTVDGDHLLATHYCSAHNQPHMRTAVIRAAPERQLAFTLDRVTGLKTPADWHNTGLVMILEDEDHLTQEWTYQYKGQTGKNVFHFTRDRGAE